MTNNEHLALMLSYLTQAQSKLRSKALAEESNKVNTKQTNKVKRDARFPEKEIPNYIMSTNSASANINETSFVSNPATNASFKLF